MSMSPVRELVSRTLVHRRMRLFEDAWPGRDALVFGGVGLDHQLGERILAFGEATESLPRASRNAGQRDVVAVTDCRLAGVTWGDKRFHVRHDEIQSFESKESLLGGFLKFGTSGGIIELAPKEFLKPLIAFYSGLGQIPRDQLVVPLAPEIKLSKEDPSGALQAYHELYEPDARAGALLQAIHRRVELGAPIPVGKDLVSRVVLAHRGFVGGVGMRDGQWQCPMGANDLLHSLTRWLGEPLQYQSNESGVASVDFQINEKDGRFAKAAGRAALAGVFMSPEGLGRALAGPLFGRKPVRRLRFLICETELASSYQVFNGAQKALEGPRPDLLLRLHGYLEAISYRILMLRCLFGWDQTFDELLSRPPALAQAKLAEYVPAADVSLFR